MGGMIVKPMTKERFFQKAVAGHGGCVVWTGNKTKDGYGTFRHDHRTKRAHRASLELSMGRPIATGLFAIHACDNRLCVNPNHLREGTLQENSADMMKKGRSAKGEQCARAKLTETQVLEIRKRRAEGESGYAIAERFDVSNAVIYQIANRHTWRHLP